MQRIWIPNLPNIRIRIPLIRIPPLIRIRIPIKQIRIPIILLPPHHTDPNPHHTDPSPSCGSLPITRIRIPIKRIWIQVISITKVRHFFTRGKISYILSWFLLKMQGWNCSIYEYTVYMYIGPRMRSAPGDKDL